MIDDPIVIRKSRGALIVSSSKATDPIQLIRQVSHNELEVHLKNGNKYIEHIGEADMQQVVLEMMGYAPHELIMSFYCWPSKEEGKLKFLTGDHLRQAGENACAAVFSPTPYMNSKFLDLTISHTEHKKKCYNENETGYSSYDVLLKFRFHARVDMADEIAEEFHKCGFHDIVKTVFVNGPQNVCANDINVYSIKVLE